MGVRRDGNPETYLGDGVYAWFDGYQIWLRADRDERSHEIALESETFLALMQYQRRLQEGGATHAPPPSGEGADELTT